MTRIAGQIHSVVVKTRGLVLDQALFEDEADAESYKRAVRRWALQRKVLVEVWSAGTEGQLSMGGRARYLPHAAAR